MKILLRMCWVIVVVGLSCCLCLAQQTTSGTRLATIDDYLKIETLGRAVVDSTGRRIVYDRKPAFKDWADYGVEWGWAEMTGGYLMLVEGDQPAKQLFPPKKTAGYWASSFSPSGNRLAFFQVERGQVSLGVYDFTNRKIVLLADTPNVLDVPGMQPLWRDDDTIVYAAMAPGEQPWAVSERRQTSVRLHNVWEKSWRGKEPSFRQLVSGSDEEPAPIPGRLVVGDVRTGRTKVLGEGGFVSPAMVAGGHYVAALKLHRLPQPDPSKPHLDWQVTRPELWLFDLDKGTSRSVFPELQALENTLDWDPDGKRLAFFAWQAGTSIQQGTFHVLDAATGKVTSWPHRGFDVASQRERGERQVPERALWFAGGLAIVARAQENPDAPPAFTYSKPAGVAASWVLLREGLPPKVLTPKWKSMWPIAQGKRGNHLFVIAEDDLWSIGVDEKPLNITAGKFGTLTAPITDWYYHALSFPLTLPNVVLIGKTPELTRYVLIALDRGHAEEISSAAHDRSVLLGPPTAHGATIFQEHGDAGSRVLLRSPGAAAREVDRLNAHLAGIRSGSRRALTYEYTARDGRKRTLKSCLHLPADYQPGRRYPVIADVYSQWQPRCGDRGMPLIDESLELRILNSMDIPEDLYGSHGYIHLDVASPAEFQREGPAPLAGIGSLAVAAIDAAIAQGYADPERVGLIGASQGGITSLWTTTQTNRFRAAVSMNGWVDPLRHYFDGSVAQYFDADQFPFPTSALRYESPTENLGIGGTPFTNAATYMLNSPLMHADLIHTPILLINSDMDGSNSGEYEAMFAALYRLKQPAKLLTYWGEGHGNSSPANVRHCWEQIFGWFDKYLQVQRPPVH